MPPQGPRQTRVCSVLSSLGAPFTVAEKAAAIDKLARVTYDTEGIGLVLCDCMVLGGLSASG